MPEITVIVPHRESEDCSITLCSLEKQTFRDFAALFVSDAGKGANWARNEGFKRATPTEFVLFSDNDIDWKSHALETLLRTLKMTKASYSYGRFSVGDVVWSNEVWNPAMLKHHNYISTMSLWRTEDFRKTGGFDESLKRLQDWDLYLNALINHRMRGVYCNDLIFTTEVKDGITHNGEIDVEEATQIISDKYDLGLKTFKLQET